MNAITGILHNKLQLIEHKKKFKCILWWRYEL